MAIIKVTNDELKQVRELRNNYQQIMLQIGQVELQLNDLKGIINDVENTKKQLLAKYDEGKKVEREKFNMLNEKYGSGTLNVDTGEFTRLPNQVQSSQPKIEENIELPIPPKQKNI